MLFEVPTIQAKDCVPGLRHALMEGGGRESPGRRVPFFRVAERKEPKKGRPHCLRPLRCAPGQPAVLGFGGVSLELAPFHFAHTHASPDPPNPALLGASRGAKGAEHPIGPSLRSAHSRGRKRHALRGPSRAKRWPEWLFGCLDVRLSTPCWLRLRRGGCGVSVGVEAPMLRALTRRGCPSGARQRKASSTAHHATDTPRVCPVAKRRGRRLGVAFLLLTFLWRSKEK